MVPGPLGPIALVRDTKTTRTAVYVHGDPQGNRLFTGKGGATVQSARYAPFGAVRNATGVPGSVTYSDNLWNGGEQADPFGIDLLGARAYDPVLGRFLQRDPLAIHGHASQAHPYGFAWSDPINHSDPSGLSPPGGGPCDDLNPNCGSGGVQVGGSVGLSVMPFGTLAATGLAPMAPVVPFTGAGAAAAPGDRGQWPEWGEVPRGRNWCSTSRTQRLRSGMTSATAFDSRSATPASTLF